MRHQIHTHSFPWSTNLRKIAVRLLQDLDHDIYLVHLSIVSQLFPHTTKDLGESSLSKALVLKDGFMRKVECIFQVKEVSVLVSP